MRCDSSLNRICDIGMLAWIARDVGPAACKAAQMDEVEIVAVVELPEKRRDRSGRERFVDRGQGFETEDRVVQVALPGPVLKPSVGIEPAVQKSCHQITGLTQLLGRQPRHLQHFEPQTHCTTLGSRHGRSCLRPAGAVLSGWRSEAQVASGWLAPCTFR